MIMCVLCYPVSFHMLQLLSTGRPISSLIVEVFHSYFPKIVNGEAIYWKIYIWIFLRKYLVYIL